MPSYAIWDEDHNQIILPPFEEGKDEYDTYDTKKEALEAFEKKVGSSARILNDDKYSLREQTRIGWAPVRKLEPRPSDDSVNLEALVNEVTEQ